MANRTAEAVLSLQSGGWKRTFRLKIHGKFNESSQMLNGTSPLEY